MKGLVAVELSGQCIQKFVCVRITPQEIPHADVGGPKRMSKPMSVYDEVEEILRAGIWGNLIFDGLVKCFHQLYTQVVAGPGLSTLL